jgi:hypothetical protein
MEGRIGVVRRFGLKDDGSQEIVYVRMRRKSYWPSYILKGGALQ